MEQGCAMVEKKEERCQFLFLFRSADVFQKQLGFLEKFSTRKGRPIPFVGFFNAIVLAERLATGFGPVVCLRCWPDDPRHHLYQRDGTR